MACMLIAVCLSVGKPGAGKDKAGGTACTEKKQCSSARISKAEPQGSGMKGVQSKYLCSAHRDPSQGKTDDTDVAHNC